MLYKQRKLISMLCLVIYYNALFMSTGSCSPTINTSEMDQEAVWISLDLPQEQRQKVDAIILHAYQEVKSIQKDLVITNISSLANIYKLMNYINQMSTIRADVADKIMQILTPEQQRMFEDQLEQKQGSADRTTAKLLALNLTPAQQAIIINLLLQSHKKVWKIISDQRLSWEKRRSKVQRRNLFKQISSLLTPDQLNLAVWMP